MTDSYISFDKGRPFFDMVAAFTVATASCIAVFNRDNPLQLRDDHFIAIEGIVTKGRHMRPLEVFDQVQAGHFSMAQYLVACCSMLANTAYESVKEKNDHSPEFEFFRHVRNAASHGNRFHFNGHEPCRAAAWRTVSLDNSRLGPENPLQGTACFGMILGVADIIDLLWDIEQRIVGQIIVHR